MSNWHVWVFKLFVIGSLLSCSSSSTDNISEYGLDLVQCSADTQKEYVHRAMQDKYLWYQDIPVQVNYTDFSSPDALVKALRRTPEDVYSYVTSVEEHDSFYTDGQYAGFGFGFVIKSIAGIERVIIRFVYEDSPAYRAGMRRSQEILSIDGTPVTELIRWNTTTGQYELEDVLGERTIGVTKSFVMQTTGLAQFSITLTKDVVTVNTVLSAKNFSHNGVQYAYLALKSFINPTIQELATAFTRFKNAGVEKLVLDLRYNGGGLVQVASFLASFIHQPLAEEVDLFSQLKFNDKYQNENTNYYFRYFQESLNLSEVIILTSGATCSASEMLINALKPFINVSVVGSTTCGKPIGMRAQTFCANKLLAINFETLNHNGNGGYFDGISANCAAIDDVNHELGDVDEGMLRAALDFDQDGVCVVPQAKGATLLFVPSYQGLQHEYAAE